MNEIDFLPFILVTVQSCPVPLKNPGCVKKMNVNGTEWYISFILIKYTHEVY